jgi:phosphoribosylformylglycinamidine synthase
MGGSIFLKTCVSGGLENNLECPILEDYEGLVNGFNIVQKYIHNGQILSLHDKSDGGLITTIIEMAISSKIGVDLTCYVNANDDADAVNAVNAADTDADLLKYLFNEELGVVCEIDNSHLKNLMTDLEKLNIKCSLIGYTNESKELSIWNNNKIFNVMKLSSLVFNWEKTSYELEKFQTNNKNVNSEYLEYPKLIKPYYYLPDVINDFCNNLFLSMINVKNNNKPWIAVIRDEGSNGDKEMCAAFKYVGFDVSNISMNELIKNPQILRKFRGIAYVGGFSHGDVFGASHGWYTSIKHNTTLSDEFDVFMMRKDTFSLGVCNGCQLMVKMGIYGDKLKLVENDSQRFESRYSTVQIRNENNIFFKNMKNMVFGIWVAHGEGKFINIDNNIYEYQKVLTYVQPTGSDYLIIDDVKYPYNPNGSHENLAGLVSQNGSHLALMPHPERCFMSWQLPHKAEYDNIKNSPWLMMFKNLYDWCVE